MNARRVRLGALLAWWLAAILVALAGVTLMAQAAGSPALTVYPFAGSPAHTFTITGVGYPAGQAVELALERPDGVALGLGLTTTTGGGLEVTLPGVGLPIGTYTITARLAGANVARAQFRVGPLPATCRDELRNGGFEAAPDFLAWNRAGDPFVAQQGAFSGQRAAVLGGYNRALDSVTQTVSLLPSASFTQLSYWRARVPEANPGADTMRVTLSDEKGMLLRTVETVEPTSAPNVWERVVASLPYSGQAVRLAFAATTDAVNPTAFGLDEAAIVSCASPPVVDPGPSAATLRPVSTPGAVAPGERVRVDVWVENIEGLYGMDASLSFDPAILKPRATQSQLGPFLNLAGQSMVTRNVVDGQRGLAQVTLTRLAPAPGASGSGVVFSLDFDAVTVGSTPLTLTNALAAAQGGTPIALERVATAVTVRVASPALGGRAEVQGRMDAAGTALRISGPVTATTTTNTSGDYRLEDLAPGAYTLTARRSGWLCAERNVTLAAGQTLTAPTVRLLAGDLDASDTIDLFDLVRVAYLYDSPASVEPVADLNNSGVVDIGDLVLVAMNYGATCPQPWTVAAKSRSPGLLSAPRVSLVSQIEAETGLRAVEVWADGASAARGVDLTLRYDARQVEVVGREPFTLGRDLAGAFVARNEARSGVVRLAASLVAAARPAGERAHVATLWVKGAPGALRVERAAWADANGGVKASGGWPVWSKAGVGTDHQLVDESLLAAPGPRWTRPVEGLSGKR